MIQATIEDKSIVIEILQTAFLNNPTMLYLIRSTDKKEYYIKKIAEYAFDFAIRRNGVFTSDSKKAVAIFYKYDFMKQDFFDFFLKLKLFVSAIDVKNLLKILYHNRRVEKTRPKHGRFFYFWFFAADPKEQPKTSAKKLYVDILRKAQGHQLDIYAETTLPKNKRVYERFGFEVYKKWFNPESKFNVWFMRKKLADKD